MCVRHSDLYKKYTIRNNITSPVKRCQFWLPAELYVCVFSNSVLHLFIKAAMVSKVMMAVHQGVSSNAGRSLKEIEVNIGEEG